MISLTLLFFIIYKEKDTDSEGVPSAISVHSDHDLRLTVQRRVGSKLVGPPGLEPGTFDLRGRCSTS